MLDKQKSNSNPENLKIYIPNINSKKAISIQDEKNKQDDVKGNTAQLPNEQKYDIIDIWKDK